MTIKKLLSLIFLCSSISFGVTKEKPVQELDVNNFSHGLDSYHDSTVLQDGYVQDSLNVYFDKQAPIEKRKGYTYAFSAVTSSSIVITAGVNDQLSYFASVNHFVTIAPGNYSTSTIVTAINTALQNNPGWSTLPIVSTINAGGFLVFSSTVNYTSFTWGASVDAAATGATFGFLPQSYVTSCCSPPFLVTSPGPFIYSSIGSQFSNLWTYTDSSNTTWIIARASTTIVANNLSGSATVVVATVSVNNQVDEINAFGNAYFVDQTQGVYYWNGSTTVYISGSPKGSIVTQYHNRLWISGQAVPNGNILNGSKFLDGTVWTTGLNPNDPVQFTIGLQDNFDNVTALYPFLDTLYATKYSSIYALYGFDNTNFQNSIITRDCGCVDKNSMQAYNKGIVFVSLRGIEYYDGYNCNRISDSVKNKIDNAIQFTSFNQNSWVQSASSDWLAGTISQLDAATYAPGLALVNISTTIQNNSFETGDFTNWTAQSNWSISSVNSGTYCTVNPPNGSFMAFDNASLEGANGIIGVSIVASTNTSVIISSASFSNTTLCNTSGFVAKSLPFTGVPGTVVKMILTDNSGNSLTSDSYYSSANSINFLMDTDTEPHGLGAYNYIDFFSGLQKLNTNYSSGTIKTQIHNNGTISSFGNFSVTSQLNSGTIAFSVCTSSNSNMSAPIACANQVANSQITVATNVYEQIYATFTISNSTNSPILNSFTIQTYNGNNRTIPMASAVYDNRYYLSVTTSPSDSANDAELILNVPGAWTIFDVHAGGLVVSKNNLYHADSVATSNVYLDNQGYNDNGVSINSFIRTRDFNLGSWIVDTLFDSLWPSLVNLGNYNVEFMYALDKGITDYTLATVNQSEFSSAKFVRIPFPMSSSNPGIAQTVNFKISASDNNEPWQFEGLSLLYHERPIQE